MDPGEEPAVGMNNEIIPVLDQFFCYLSPFRTLKSEGLSILNQLKFGFATVTFVTRFNIFLFLSSEKLTEMSMGFTESICLFE